jgi:hypothetical protein
MRFLLAALALLLLGPSAAWADGRMCGPPAGPVLIVIVESKARVPKAAAGLSSTRRLVDTADTVIYADGRAVTSDLASVSAHLNELGWAKREIQIASAGTRLPPPDPGRPRRG